MPTALSNRHSHSKSKQYLERQPVSCLGPTRSWFQIQWPFLYHPCWGTALSYCPWHSVSLFSLISMTSLSSLLSFCWSSKCWDTPDLRNRPQNQTSVSSCSYFSLVLQSKIEKQLSFLVTPTKLLSLHICITILYYLVYSHTHTHTHTHTQVFLPLF